jgi:hypothetical protein
MRQLVEFALLGVLGAVTLSAVCENLDLAGWYTAAAQSLSQLAHP